MLSQKPVGNLKPGTPPRPPLLVFYSNSCSNFLFQRSRTDFIDLRNCPSSSKYGPYLSSPIPKSPREVQPQSVKPQPWQQLLVSDSESSLDTPRSQSTDQDRDVAIFAAVSPRKNSKKKKKRSRSASEDSLSYLDLGTVKNRSSGENFIQFGEDFLPTVMPELPKTLGNLYLIQN